MAQATLGAERGLTMLELAERLGNAGFRWLVQASPLDDPIVADRLAQFETEITGLRGLCRKVVEDNEAGTAGPADASIVKLYYSELLQRLTDFGAEIGGLRRAYRTGQTDVQRLGVRLVGAGLHRLVGVDDPRRVERDPAHDHRRARSGTAAGTERGLMAHEFAEFHDELRSVAGDLLAKDRAVDWPVLAGAGWVGLEVPDEFGGAGATFAEVAVICEEMGRAASANSYLGSAVPALVDAGWVGLEVPEQFGGAGATFAEVAVICQEMGRAASANSYLGSAVLAVGTLKALQPSDTRDPLLADVASGAVRVAVALEPSEFVPDAEGADRILVIADGGVVERRRDRHAATRARRNTPAGHGVGRRRRGRGGAAIRRRPRRRGSPAARPRRGRDRVRQPRAHARQCFPPRWPTRRCATSSTGRSAPSRRSSTRAPTCWSAIAVSRQLVGAAVEAVAEDRPDAGVAAAMAKSYACGAAVDVVGKAMQLHGGIGYTWESGIHVYLKRAALNRSLFGSPAAHRKRTR